MIGQCDCRKKKKKSSQGPALVLDRLQFLPLDWRQLAVVVCFPKLSEESFSNPLLPCWEAIVGEASHRTYDTDDKRDFIQFSQIKKGSLWVII